MFTKHFQDLEQLSIYDLINYIKSRLNVTYQSSKYLLPIAIHYPI